MSKLLKFKACLTPQEAATYLSALIAEEVNEDQIASLFYSEWLPAELLCACQLVRLEPAYEQELHEALVASGRYELKEAERIGMCFSLQFPCSIVTLHTDENYRQVFTLRDEEGNFYALFDEAEGQFHPIQSAESDEVDTDGLRYLPRDIFLLSELANTSGLLADEKPNLRREVKNLLAPIRLFNLMPNEAPIKPKKEASPNSEPLSSKLLIGALLEILNDINPRQLTQDAIATKIEDKFKGIRGLGLTTTRTTFAAANKALKSAKKDIEPKD